MRFEVIDKKTKKPPDFESIANEDWANRLIYCDIYGFALTEDGALILCDDCGNFVYCPHGRFSVTIYER